MDAPVPTDPIKLAQLQYLELKAIRQLSQPLNKRFVHRASSVAGSNCLLTSKAGLSSTPYQIPVPTNRPRGKGWPFSSVIQNLSANNIMRLWYGDDETNGKVCPDNYETVQAGDKRSYSLDYLYWWIQFDANTGSDDAVDFIAAWLDESKTEG